MMTATFLQIFGLLYLAIGLIAVAHPKQLKAGMESLTKNAGTSLTVGFLSLIFGATIIVLHSYWSGPAEIFISIIGWGAFIKGICYIGFPDLMKSSAGSFLKSEKRMRFMGGVIALFGAGIYIVGVL